MSTVTRRIKEIKQPYGGYIKPYQFEVRQLDDKYALYEKENIHASIIGTVVDYFTRCIMGADLIDGFMISLKGADIASKLGRPDSMEKAKSYIYEIKGTDDKSIINACKLVSYDVWYRDPAAARLAKSDDESINPDSETIWNIQVLINRCLEFWEQYGPIVVDGFTFNEKAYTKTVTAGDGDFLTKDTIWDLKVLKSKPNNKHTLQLLMYWIMGQHSEIDYYKDLTRLGIFNPRLNTVYTLKVSDISLDIISAVERDVICY